MKEYLTNPIIRILDSSDLLLGENIKNLIKEILQIILDSIRILKEGESATKEEDVQPEIVDPKGFLLKITQLIPKPYKLK